MKFDLNSKKVVGIDISPEYISVVVLKGGSKGPQILKAVSTLIPAGAIKDGNIVDGKLLAKAIRDIRYHHKIFTRQAAVSFFGRPVVTQIMDLPKPVPTNIRQFVQNEVKNCVVLPGRDITLDFHGLGSTRKGTEKKLLVVAAESEKPAALIKVCADAGFTAEVVEPAVFAYLRATSERKGIGKGRTNVLFAMLRATALTLCVLKNGEIDFIRNKEIAENSKDAGDIEQRLVYELSDVIKFYDIEDTENSGKWEIKIFIDKRGQTKQIEQLLKTNPDLSVRAAQMQVTTFDDRLDTFAASTSFAENPSPVALGLALRLLLPPAGDIRINMMPQEIIKHRQARKDVLIAGNAIALAVLIMLLAVNVFAFMIQKATSSTIAGKAVIAKLDTESLVLHNQQLEEKVQMLAGRLQHLTQILELQNDVNWVQLLDEIRKATPGSVRINRLSSADGSRIIIDGLATSNEAVNLFVGLLEKTKLMASVTLLDAHKYNEQSQVISYQISCKLNFRRAKPKNVS